MKNLDDIFEYLKITANLISQSRFGNQIILKGGSVLISKMIENNRLDLYRKTTDIDIHCDRKDVWIDFYTNIESILNQNTLGYIYKITSRRSTIKGLVDSDSLKFSLDDIYNNRHIEFKMDMNIKSNHIITCEYSPILNMNTYDALTMLADKIVVVSSNSIYRRIKDLYDLIVLVSMYDFSYADIMLHIQTKHPNACLSNMLIQDNFSDIEHAFSKYSGIANKPNIQTVVGVAQLFLQPIYYGSSLLNLVWSKDKVCWIQL